VQNWHHHFTPKKREKTFKGLTVNVFKLRVKAHGMCGEKFSVEN
jgi:hypothetical protein